MLAVASRALRLMKPVRTCSFQAEPASGLPPLSMAANRKQSRIEECVLVTRLKRLASGSERLLHAMVGGADRDQT
jgi:hypothetical protein